jgi:hypothetical protein
MTTVRNVVYEDYIIGQVRALADEICADGGELSEQYPWALVVHDVLTHIGVSDAAIGAVLGPEMDWIDKRPVEPLPCQYCQEGAGAHLVVVRDGYRVACEQHAREAEQAGYSIISLAVQEPVKV